MKYTLFLDESGDHGLSKPNPDFPVFLLCGVLVAEKDYESIRTDINQFKESILQDKKIILHSRDIRKCEKSFKTLFDQEIKKSFYERLNQIVSQSEYTIVASAIRKTAFIDQFGRLKDDVYEVALSFVIEQAAIILLETTKDAQLDLVIEKRGAREDNRLAEHFQSLCSNGAGKIKADHLCRMAPRFIFRNKKENINGLQLADLIAYPIARHVIEPDKINLAFDVLQSKIYRSKNGLEGLRIYP